MPKLTLRAEPGSHALEMSGVFEAPRELVFRAHTDPELVAQWWGSKATTTEVDVLEARPGGRWRYVDHGPEGEVYAFSGVYHRVSAPDQLIYTFEFEQMPGQVVLETMTLEELPDGKTRIVNSSVFPTVEIRDEMLGYGMEDGAQESWDQLEELLQRLRQEAPVSR